jgi:signal transduction histidine kinase/DNA-binding NarL/FixJ family response regulator
MIENFVETIDDRVRNLETELKNQQIHYASFFHELKNPIHCITNSLGVLKQNFLAKGDISEENKMILDAAIDCGDVLLTQIANILDWSKITASKLEISSTNSRVQTLISKIFSFGRSQALMKNVEWIGIMDPFMPEHLMVDTNRITQMVVNLMGNAFKFTQSGKVLAVVSWIPEKIKNVATPSISLDDCSKMNIDEIKMYLYNHFKKIHAGSNFVLNKVAGSLQFEVIDTGIGISNKDQEHLFGAYSQANKDIVGEYGGNGLGLWLCKKVTELMSGTIKIHSIPSKGSNFILSIPTQYQLMSPFIAKTFNTSPPLFADVSSKKTEMPPRPLTSLGMAVKPEAEKVLSSMNILLVDDSPFNLLITKSIIEKQGALVEVAGNGEEMIKKIQNYKNYDAVITDIRMPILDGKSAVKLIRKDERAGRLPRQHFIFVTADDTQKTELTNYKGEYQALDVLIKPFNQQTLLDVLIKLKNKSQIIASSNTMSSTHLINSIASPLIMPSRTPHSVRTQFEMLPQKSLALDTSKCSKKILVVYAYGTKAPDREIEELLQDNLVHYVTLKFTETDEQQCFQRLIRHLKGTGITTVVFMVDDYPNKTIQNVISRIRIIEKTSNLSKKKVFYCYNRKNVFSKTIFGEDTFISRKEFITQFPFDEL